MNCILCWLSMTFCVGVALMQPAEVGCGDFLWFCGFGIKIFVK